MNVKNERRTPRADIAAERGSTSGTEETRKITDYFGEDVFGDAVMKERLPAHSYETLKKCVDGGIPLSFEEAKPIAKAMLDWAIGKGATHFTHWFQPLTGVTAEKHDSFLDRSDEGEPILKFSAKALVKGEPDASSFPSGGLRATFEARGYTAWDPSSYAFVKNGSLYIPTAFCSYSGEALDKKTPLLRSLDALSEQAVKVLRLFGKTGVKKVKASVGAEQEYFLVDKSVYEKRPDLVTCGRTLFGAKPPKGQELEDHYFGKIKTRVAEFMADLDRQLWKLGVFSKTKHNEVAPSQHELAPVFTEVNIATDHNQLVMALMKSVANEHGLVCLLQEKPFEGVNGSGKHNNWSLCADDGENLLAPGEKPAENLQFLLFFTSIIAAVDDYQELLRISVASAGNDHRLGANEAPPAIVSMFIGDELDNILQSVAAGKNFDCKGRTDMEPGASILPHFYKDTSDRNRTSPFAFTGNKFEFRMVGSAQSIASPNIVLNTIAAQKLKEAYEALKDGEDFTQDLKNYIGGLYNKHKRIIFNGNNYAPEWIEEAARRGLANLKTTVDAYECFMDEKNVRLFVENGVLSRAEMLSRKEISFESYYKTISIEAATMLEMLNKQIIPSVIEYKATVAVEINALKSASDCIIAPELALLSALCEKSVELADGKAALVTAISKLRENKTCEELAFLCRDRVLPAMNKLRAAADALETITGKKYWTMPDYSDILYSVKY